MKMYELILGLIVSIFLIIGGLSGAMVLRGTDSSELLIIVGVIFLIIDLYLIFTRNKDKKEE